MLAAAGGGLLLGCRVDERGAQLAGRVRRAARFAPNAFVRIGTDGRVTLIMPQVEMGQGMYTSMPMLVAEELEVGLDQVQLEHAPPDDKLYAQSALRLPDDRRLELGARDVRAAAEGGRGRAHHARRRGGAELERRSGVVPGARRVW